MTFMMARVASSIEMRLAIATLELLDIYYFAREP
jgi:hypothetical protein